jgi:TP901 family phage tail tape measure protein
MRLEGGKEVEVDAKGVASAVGDVGEQAERSAAQTQRASRRMTSSMDAIGKWGKRTRETGRSMTWGMTLPIVGLGVAAVHAAGDFERSMAQVRVATGAPEKTMGRLNDLAKELGASTKFSAGEAAEAMLELGKSGMAPAQIQGGALKASMDLAAAGNIGLAESANLTGAAMNTFELKARQAKNIADALAGGANASAADVTDLAQALSQGGSSAAGYGLSLNETVGALAAFSERAIRGSDAGTSFKTFLARLNPETKKARELMEELGLSFFDAEGNLKGLPAIAGELQDKLSGFTQKEREGDLQTLFGSDAIRAARVLYNEGAEGVAQFTRATEKQGAASKMANAFMEGSAGKIEEAKGAMETAAITAGVALAPAVVMLAGFVSDLMEGFAALPEPVQQFIIVGAGVLAIAGPLLMFIGSAAAAIPVLSAALAFLAANPVVLVIAGLVALGVGFVIAYKKIGWFRDGVNAVWSWIKGHWPLILGFLTGPVGLAVAYIVTHWEQVISFFNSLPGRAGNALGAFADTLGDWGKTAGEAFVNALIGLINDGISAINDTLDEGNALSFLGVDAPNIPEITPLGGGGSGSGRGPSPKAPPRVKKKPQGQGRARNPFAVDSFAGRPIHLYLSPNSAALATGVLEAGEDEAALR